MNQTPKLRQARPGRRLEEQVGDRSSMVQYYNDLLLLYCSVACRYLYKTRMNMLQPISRNLWTIAPMIVVAT